MLPAKPAADLRRLSGAAAADLWAGLAEGGVRQRLKRLVQGGQLAGDPDQLILAVEVAVQRLHLGDQPVQALEHCLELPVGEVSWLIHRSRF